jgi:hypothetical protein
MFFKISEQVFLDQLMASTFHLRTQLLEVYASLPQLIQAFLIALKLLFDKIKLAEQQLVLVRELAVKLLLQRLYFIHDRCFGWQSIII